MRLITRSDFDGLVCAMLFKKMNMIDEMKFVHPKDVQDGLIEVTKNDILANVPYAEGCGLWFDHHSSEMERVKEKGTYEGESRIAPSAARVVYDYYGGREKFGPELDDIMAGVDKADAAQFSADDILYPKGWDLLSFLMDARTGLGRFRDFRISNYQLMEQLVDHCAYLTIDQILELPDVKERVDRYFEMDTLFRDMIKKHTRIEGNVIVTDLRDVETIYAGNRFMVYEALSGAERFDLDRGRTQQTKLRIRLRPQHCQPHGSRGHRLAHAAARRRRPQGGGHVPSAV
ncbi:exopolyphosphatase [Paenibacillus thermotolerans]|uniref:exopolyphosphatase n=1 Tax=Paenibacillus thermotolerans TaxID=3027807 RepID=UPI002368E2EA|nr:MULTISPECIES: exopolyphosphatase [unclassified Paenibacillus]